MPARTTAGQVPRHVRAPRAAFDALSPLCLTGTAEEMLAEAGFDSHGELRSVEFSWQKRGNQKNKSWDNTITPPLDPAIIAELRDNQRLGRSLWAV